jgi:glycosyltransferase involved in cell wall biosynthesis
MKIAVYAICKDEAQFARRWIESMSEADEIYVLDTGSGDGTPELLRLLGAHVTVEEIRPWRFDTARNRALELVPADVDICVCTDLDEVFHPGWRTLLEREWRPGTGQVSYRYTWNFNSDGSEGVVFWPEKIHARRGYRWAHPVHEVLRWEGNGQPRPVLRVDGIQLDHHADPAKSRGQYLPLLELSVLEEPDDDRNVHYLGREYMFHGQWEKCIVTLKRHLIMPSATWEDERCASMRYIAAAAEQLGRMPEAEQWHLRAVAEAPYLREPLVGYARFLYGQKAYAGTLCFAEKALEIQERPRTYITEAESWGALPWDLAALAAWYLGLREKALYYGSRAVELRPDDERLRENLRYYAGEI